MVGVGVGRGGERGKVEMETREEENNPLYFSLASLSLLVEVPDSVSASPFEIFSTLLSP